ncbi:ABC transporter ATP-binding protein [Amycolatopsis aidingensis]|uniref:ABC transporter ATP-binding protein n=1 Tax=Amycolatopsis aidingensis TaxID=2842453 RepID=UPI001C0C672B|nr:ABC transporter ATP-binding protein [Amycolatopsis aidingensis]
MRPADRLLCRTLLATRVTGILLVAAGVVDAATRIAIPAVLGAALDEVLGGAGPLSPASSLLLALLLVAVLAEPAREYLARRCELLGMKELRDRSSRHAISLGAQSRFAPADSQARLLESTAEAARVSTAGLTLLTSVCTSVAGLVALVLIDLPVALVFLCGAPLVWWLTRWLIGRVGRMTGRYQRAHADLAERFLDALTGIRTIRASGTAEREIGRILGTLGELRETGHDYWETQRRAGWQLGLLTPLLAVAALSVAGLGLLAGRLSAGELVAVSSYLTYALGLLRQASVLAKFARARGSAERLSELLAQPVPPEGYLPAPVGALTVRLRGVSACHGHRRVLGEVNLDIPAGSSVAVLGSDGAAASLLAEVVAGLRIPDQGAVLVNGVAQSAFDSRALRERVGFAFARPHLLGNTVADAVAYTDEPPAPDRVETALDTAAARPFVDRLPEGAATPLPGLRLSGGETQRLGIARAVCRDVGLLVLDDALSSVDTVTESTITEALRTVAPGATRLIVTHRATTADAADLVVWLDGGQVRATGPHRELLNQAGYAALFGSGQPQREAAS